MEHKSYKSSIFFRIGFCRISTGKTLTQLLCLELILLLGFAYYWMLGKSSNKKPYGFAKFGGAGEISWRFTMIHKSGFPKKTSPFFHNQNPSLWGNFNPKTPKELYASNCFLHSSHLALVSSSSDPKNNWVTHSSGKVWRWVRRACWLLLFFFVFFSFAFGGNHWHTHTHFWRKKMVWTITRGGGDLVVAMIRREKKIPKKTDGFCCAWLLWSPLFFLEVKVMLNTAPKERGWQGPQCQKAGVAPVMEGSPQGWATRRPHLKGVGIAKAKVFEKKGLQELPVLQVGYTCRPRSAPQPTFLPLMSVTSWA